MVVTELCANPFDHRYQKAFRVQSLSIEEGLSQSVVNDIVQDSEGYIWLATEDGLNRFDGYEFKVFHHIHGDVTSLHNNMVLSLYEQEGIGLWLGTQNGLSFYDFSTDKFSNFATGKIDKLSNINAITQINKNALIVASENGLYRLFPESRKIELLVSSNQKVIEDEVISFKQDDEHLWIATEKCVYTLSKSELELVNICEQSSLASILVGTTINDIAINNNTLWVGTIEGLIEYKIREKNHQLFTHQDATDSISSNWIQSLKIDANNDLWVGTGSGLNLFKSKERVFERYSKQVYDSDGLSSDDVLTIYIDNSGLIWLGTYTGGVNILDPLQMGFKHILTKSDVSQFGKSNTIHGIAKDKSENLWVASIGSGVIKLDLMTGEITTPFKDSQIDKTRAIDYSYSLLTDLDELLWIGTIEGLFIADLKTEKLLNSSIYIDGLEQGLEEYITQIYEDHDGRIFITTSYGLYQVQAKVREQDSINLILKRRTRELPLSFRDRSSSLSSIVETRDGNLWLGGSAGLLFYSQSSEEWRHFEYHSENPQSISDDDVQVLFEDSRGILWVGTANGLNKVDRSTEEEIYFERITKANGLPNNAIYGILEDPLRQIWLSTNLGLVRYSDFTESMQSFRSRDGLSSDEFNKSAFYSDTNGLLYFGSINGITVVDSKEVKQPSRQSNLKLSEVRVGQNNLDVYKLNQIEMPSIEKREGDSSIKISVAELFYRKLGTQSYRYRILGLSDKWINLGKERSFILAGMDEGEYIINIQSRIGDDPWSKDTLTLTLNVYEEFWSSVDAVYLVVFTSLVLFGISASVIRRYYRSQIQKKDNRLKIESVRLKDVRRQNEEIKSELSTKISKISELNEELSDANELIDSHTFREPISGFYRYNNLDFMLSDLAYEDDLLDNLNLVMVFQLVDFIQLKQKFGTICGAEVRAYVASELRKLLPSNVHLCFQSEDSFIVFW